MSIQRQVDEAVYLLDGLESGHLDAAAVYNKLKDYDPVLIHFYIRYLRDKYPPTHPAAEGVMARLLDLTGTYADIVQKARSGEKDIIREWFDETYSMREFFNDKEKFLQLLIEKLEG